VLIASSWFLEAWAPAIGSDRTPEAKAALQERDRLWDQSQKLRAAGKTAEALAAAKAVLAIERKVRPAGHDDLLSSLDWLAKLHAEREDFAAAQTARREVLDILRQRHGEAHWKVADAQRALEDLDRQAGMTAERRQKLAQADRLDRESGALYRAAKYAESASSARQALALRKEVLGERHPAYATGLNDLATVLQAQGDYAAARSLYEQALGICKVVLGEHHPDYALLLNNLAMVLKAQGDSAGARPLLEKTLAIRKEVLGERHPDTATSLHNLAHLLQGQGDSAAARLLLEQALAIRKEVLGERHPNYAAGLNNLATLLYSQGDYAAARPLLERALAVYRDVRGERHPDYLVGLSNLAGLLSAQGDYAAARPLLERALALRKEVLGERHPDYLLGLNNLAALFQEQGDYAAARPLLERAVAITKEAVGERQPLYTLYVSNLAMLLDSQGDSAGARRLLERAVAINEEVVGERHPSYVRSLNSLAMVVYEQGDYAAARSLFERVLAVRRGVLGQHHPDTAVSLNNLAVALCAQGDCAAARSLHQQALAINEEVVGERHPYHTNSLNNLALVLWQQRDYAGAAALLDRAIAASKHNLDLDAATQSERQQLVMSRKFRGSLDACLTLAPLAAIAPDSVYRHVLAVKGSVFERQRRLRAQRRRLQADPQSEAAHRFAEYQETVRRLASLALATPDPRQAGAWKDRVAELSRRKDELESELARLDAGFRAAQAEANRTPEQLRASLPHGTVLIDLLEYTACLAPAGGKGKFAGEARLVAFVVRPDRPIARVDLGPIEPIARAIDGWRPGLVAPRVPPEAAEAARAVRRLAWEPLERHLEGVGTVLVSPDGPIALVPLGALPGKEAGSYLIEERTIAVVPVPRMLGSTGVNPATSGPGGPAPSLLLAGDIDYGGEPGAGADRGASRSAATADRDGALIRFRRLPATSDEIAAIGRAFRGAEPLVLSGDRATEAALRREAPRHTYLHVATHGYFAPPQLRSALGPGDQMTARSGLDALGGAGVAGYHPGLLSGIALAGANHRPAPVGQDDGILTALEVAELDLSTVELAVLSACETGLGEVAGGEGLLGLQRAFQVAGARSVVASLWKVGDEPTRVLMIRFCENLWRRAVPPSEALREAQLQMLREGRRLLREGGQRGLEPLEKGQAADGADRLPPCYWAAFVLSTDRP
jgi:CHAT domain-containing protein/Flp pilus assembly protein TadD